MSEIRYAKDLLIQRGAFHREVGNAWWSRDEGNCQQNWVSSSENGETGYTFENRTQMKYQDCLLV